MGGLVRIVLDLKSRVEILEKRLDENHLEDVNNIMEKQIIIDKAIAVNAAAIMKIDEELQNGANKTPLSLKKWIFKLLRLPC